MLPTGITDLRGIICANEEIRAEKDGRCGLPGSHLMKVFSKHQLTGTQIAFLKLWIDLSGYLDASENIWISETIVSTRSYADQPLAIAE